MSDATTGGVHVLALDDLDVRQNGHRLRAFCPVHGGDHQRSLSIETDGDYAGYGYCHSCRVKVFVPELNPDEAAMRTNGQGHGPRPSARRPLTAETLLRPLSAKGRTTPPTTPADWQRDELAALARLVERMRARLLDERPQAYLAARGIPLEFAQALGVGYIPADAKLTGQIAKWRDRIIFPLGSPDGRGYAGRSLALWEPGMDEGAHKALLEATPDAPRRWEKTYPAGWFNYDALASSQHVVIVEGPFDLLALMHSISDRQIVATVGTAARMAWLPRSVRGVVLAFDADTGGQGAALALARDASIEGLQVAIATPPADGFGKDWSERWRRASWDGVVGPADALLDMELSGVATTPVTQITQVDTPLSVPFAADVDPLWAEALADPVVKELMRLGFTVADVYPIADASATYAAEPLPSFAG